MSLDPCIFFQNFWKSIKIQIPKVGIHLGVCGFIPHIIPHSRTMKCDSWASLLARTFTSLYLGREPKVREKMTLGCSLVAKHKKYYKGEGGGSP
jgi:hypothetical protein